MERTLANYEILSPQVKEILRKIDAVTLPLAQAVENGVERLRPLGLAKYRHMQELALEAFQLPESAQLTRRDIELLTIVCRAHDIGRHIEALRGANTLRHGVRHGVLSKEFLEQHPDILVSLEESEREDVLSAVEHHSERVARLTGRAERLCYYLRDLDKLELLERPFTSDQTLIKEELKMHYLRGTRHKNPEIDAWWKSRLSKIYIRRGVSRFKNESTKKSLLQAFFAKETIPVQDIRYSWATYMLLHLAMIFDLRSPEVISKIVDQPELYMLPRLRFLAARHTKPLMKNIIAALVDFLASKTPGLDARIFTKKLHQGIYHMSSRSQK